VLLEPNIACNPQHAKFHRYYPRFRRKDQRTYCVDGKLSEENKWEIPVAWKAVVKDGLIAEWRVYADNSPIFRIMETIKQNLDE